MTPRQAMALACCLLLCLNAACHESSERGTRPESPRRIAVLAPAAAEMLAALDLLDRVVAIGDFGPWPEPIGNLPSIGGFDSPNAERLLELDCDLVVTSTSDAASTALAGVEALGIEVLALDTATYDGVFEALLAMGRRFGEQDAAARRVESMRAEIDSLARRATSLERRRVLVVVGRDPLYVAGPGSHIDRMIQLVGGVNVAADAAAAYQQLSMEAALQRMPDVIVDTSDNRPGTPRGRLGAGWERWEFLPAVRMNRVFSVEPRLLVIPGMRLPEMVELMGRLIHPEVFGEPDALLAAGIPE